jgi:methionyl-tRNA formyltransferase
MTARARYPLRTIFFGTAEFAVPALIALLEAGHEVLAVVTQPDKPQGRGQLLTASPVKKVAEQAGLTVWQPRRVRSDAFIQKARALAPDVLTLAAFGQIIPQALLDLPPLGPINVHGSLLPKYRGAAPIQRALMAGETVTGVTTMWMDATLDTGDMLLAKAEPIRPEDTYGTLAPRLAVLGAQLLLETLDGLASGTLARRPQDHAQATLAPAITPDDTWIRWSEPAQATVNRIRGLCPRPGAFTQFREKRLKVWQAEALSASDFPGSDRRQAVLPGTVLDVNRRYPGVTVLAGEGTALALRRVQPESRGQMPAQAWANGLRIVPGEVFSDCAAQERE